MEAGKCSLRYTATILGIFFVDFFFEGHGQSGATAPVPVGGGGGEVALNLGGGPCIPLSVPCGVTCCIFTNLQAKVFLFWFFFWSPILDHFLVCLISCCSDTHTPRRLQNTLSRVLQSPNCYPRQNGCQQPMREGRHRAKGRHCPPHPLSHPCFISC